jgi:Fuc2NAc and GlcNAc transferase
MPKARVFMGDVGSVLLGFVFAGLVVGLSRSLIDFVVLCGFLFPFYADELSTMAVRIKDGENLLRPHRRHIYQLLANEMEVAHWKVSVAYGIFQVIVGLSVRLLRPFGLFPVLGVLATYFLAFAALGYAIRKHVSQLDAR